MRRLQVESRLFLDSEECISLSRRLEAEPISRKKTYENRFASVRILDDCPWPEVDLDSYAPRSNHVELEGYAPQPSHAPSRRELGDQDLEAGTAPAEADDEANNCAGESAMFKPMAVLGLGSVAEA